MFGFACKIAEPSVESAGEGDRHAVSSRFKSAPLHAGRAAQDFVKKLLQNPEAQNAPASALPAFSSRAQMLEKYRADVEYVDSKRRGPRETVAPQPRGPKA